MLPSAQWYWACSGSTLTDRSARPFKYQTSARTGKTANRTAASTRTTAVPARTSFAPPPPPPPPPRGGGGRRGPTAPPGGHDKSWAGGHRGDESSPTQH